MRSQLRETRSLALRKVVRVRLFDVFPAPTPVAVALSLRESVYQGCQGSGSVIGFPKPIYYAVLLLCVFGSHEARAKIVQLPAGYTDDVGFGALRRSGMLHVWVECPCRKREEEAGGCIVRGTQGCGYVAPEKV